MFMVVIMVNLSSCLKPNQFLEYAYPHNCQKSSMNYSKFKEHEMSLCTDIETCLRQTQISKIWVSFVEP